jgi:K+:H+ antiporter
MNVGGVALFLGHVAACLAAVLALAWAGRMAARALRQPEVIGEVTGGLLTGPVLLALAGPHAFHLLLPASVLGALKLVGNAGLALFLVGLMQELRAGSSWVSRRAASWIAFGALVPALCAGTLLAGWVLLMHEPVLRGSAPLPAFVLFAAVALSITAVPVLARILADRGQMSTPTGRLALAGAVIVDAAGWILLSIVIGLNAGSAAGSLRVLAVMAVAALAAVALRRVLRTRLPLAAAARWPRLATVAIAAATIAVTLAAPHLGVSMIFGAVAFGLSLPVAESPAWAAAVAPVITVGRVLVPVFFVATGVTVFTSALGPPPWALLTLAVALGIAGKIGGGYLGSRLAGQSRPAALRIGVLMNTRGLTELIVLQAGFSAGIATPRMFLALVVMALATTAITGPLLSLLDRAPSLAGEPAATMTGQEPA